MKPTILFIVAESRSANGVCCHAVMKELYARGCRVICLCNREYGGDARYECDGILYETVKPRLSTRLYDRVKNAPLGSWKGRLLKVLFFVVNKGKLLLSIGTWPWISPAYTRRFDKQLARLAKQYEIDGIVPVYKQIDPLISAHRFQKRMAKKGKHILTVPYFLDPLSGGIGPKIFNERQMIRRGQAWERRVLDTADSVIVMEAARENHETHNRRQPYYGKLVYMDIPLLCLNRRAEEEARPAGEEIIVFYGGTLHEPMRNVTRMLRLIEHMQNEHIRFVFAGFSSNPTKLYGIPRVEYLGEVTHDRIDEQLARADVLLNLGVTRTTAISGKIFEYMATGKPIVSTYSIDREACLPYLSRYPLAYLLDERETDLQAQAGELERFILQSRGRRADTSLLRKTFARNLPETTAAFLRDAVEKHQQER